MQNERFKVIAATHLFLVKQGKILLLRRFNTGFEDGNYSVPAGHLDGKETAMQATIREAKEEAGIEIKPEDMEAVHVMNRLSGGVERIDFFFKAEKCTGEPRNTEPHKCDGLGWFEIEKLPENMVPYVRQAIICMHKGDFYSEFGWEK